MRSLGQVLNFFFYKNISQVQKSTKALKANKNKKNAYKRHLREKKSLIHFFTFRAFVG